MAAEYGGIWNESDRKLWTKKWWIPEWVREFVETPSTVPFRIQRILHFILSKFPSPLFHLHSWASWILFRKYFHLFWGLCYLSASSTCIYLYFILHIGEPHPKSPVFSMDFDCSILNQITLPKSKTSVIQKLKGDRYEKSQYYWLFGVVLSPVDWTGILSRY